MEGSSKKSPDGPNQTGYAVGTSKTILVAKPHYSAQAAEIIALNEACKIAKGKTVTIYMVNQLLNAI